jgi:hypothetical protein
VVEVIAFVRVQVYADVIHLLMVVPIVVVVFMHLVVVVRYGMYVPDLVVMSSDGEILTIEKEIMSVIVIEYI